MRFTKLFLALVPALMIGASIPAYADGDSPQTANLIVDATVAKTCHVETSAVHFGTYDHLATSPTDGAGSISIDCTAGTTPTISLNEGGGGSSTQRSMQNGAARLDYDLYQDSGHSTAWPINTAVNAAGAVVTADVYGRIPTGQNKPEGSYSDTVVVTVVF